MRVSHEYHTVSPGSELKDRWIILGNTALGAKALGNNELFNQIYTLIRSEYSAWMSHAEEICNKKSFSNWLGGGITYSIDLGADPLSFIDTIAPHLVNKSMRDEVLKRIREGEMRINQEILFGRKIY